MGKNMIKGFPNTHEEVITNFRKARAHIDEIIEIIKHKKHCMLAINLSKAAQNSLKGANSMILENHLRSCFSDFKNGKNLNNCVKEIIKVFKANTKRI